VHTRFLAPVTRLSVSESWGACRFYIRSDRSTPYSTVTMSSLHKHVLNTPSLHARHRRLAMVYTALRKTCQSQLHMPGSSRRPMVMNKFEVADVHIEI
jgi:hypothetical protein